MVRTARRALFLLLALSPHAGAQVITASPDPAHAILSAPVQSWADGLMNAPLTAGNRFVLLENGVRSFPEKLALVSGAQQHVFFSTMIAGWDTTGRQLAQGFIDAAARGVEVRCLLDGQRTDPRFYLALRRGGVKV